MELAEADPKGLVRESYRIEGITAGECRSIFLDWALSLVVGQDVPAALNRLIAEYVAANPGASDERGSGAGAGRALGAARRGGRLGRT